MVLSIFLPEGYYAQNGPCLGFNGNSNKVTTNNLSLNTIGTGNFTFEAWVDGEIVSTSAHPTIFSNRASLNQGAVFFFHDYSGGSLYKMLSVKLNGTNYFVVDNGSYNGEILNGECHHVAVSRNIDTLTFYVDGIPFGTNTITGSPTVSANQKIWIGQDPLINNTFDGSISMVKIWNKALTESELNASMFCDSMNYSGLIANWRLDEGSGQFVQEELSGSLDYLGTGSLGDIQDPLWNHSCCTDTTGCSNPATPGDTTTGPPPPPVVVVKVDVELTMPNVVTPDSDGINDLLTPISIKGIKEMECTVLNRWGNIMYKTTDLQINWDASKVAEGVYFYRIKYVDENEEEGSVSGFFHVIH